MNRGNDRGVKGAQRCGRCAIFLKRFKSGRELKDVVYITEIDVRPWLTDL